MREIKDCYRKLNEEERIRKYDLDFDNYECILEVEKNKDCLYYNRYYSQIESLDSSIGDLILEYTVFRRIK